MPEQMYELPPEAAEFYEATFVPALFAPWAARLVDFIGIGPGRSVLDVACGTGIVARTASDRAGAGMVVTGVDRNEAMLTVARRLRPDLDWRRADATRLPFADASFDTVLCQAALMFFPDRVAALREMARVVGGGTVGVQVPGRLDHSPGYQRLTEVAARHAGSEVIGLLDSYFAAGDPDELTRTVEAAGLVVDQLLTWTGATRLPSIDIFLDAELLPLADRVDPGTHERIRADCHTALAPFVDPGGAIAAPIEVHLLAAHPA